MKKSFLTRFVSAIVAITAIFVGTALAQDAQRKNVILQGATTVASIIDPWAKAFQEGKGNTSIIVYGSTDGKGLAALLNKQADVAMLGKALSAEDKAKATELGMKLEQVFLGNDAIAIIVNPANPVNELSFDQLREIFTGRFKSWNNVGGLDEPIEVVTLQPDSAMRQFIGKTLLKGDFGSDAQVVSSITLTPKIVQARKSAISICRQDLGTSGHDSGSIKMIKLRKDDATPAVMPTADSVASGEYPIIRGLYLVYDARSASESSMQFIEFCKKKIEAEQKSGRKVAQK